MRMRGRGILAAYTVTMSQCQFFAGSNCVVVLSAAPGFVGGQPRRRLVVHPAKPGRRRQPQTGDVGFVVTNAALRQGEGSPSERKLDRGVNPARKPAAT